MTLADIEKIVEVPLKRFRQTYQLTLTGEIEIINNIGNQLLDSHGKQLRPLILLLSAGAGGADFDGMEQLAVAVELLHNSTLLHDDVVDQSEMRRGNPTISSQYGNKIAVLCGDYFLAKVMLLMNEYNDKEVNRILDRAVMEMSTGEILQQHRSQVLDSDMQHYRDTIHRKTASLMSACAELGALNTPWRLALKEYGRHFGMAFQLRDDILDYQPSSFTGKSTGNDLREHKLTMPLIMYMKGLSEEKRKAVWTMLNSDTISDDDVTTTVAAVNESRSMELCYKAINDELLQAYNTITALPPSCYKNGLTALLQFLSQA
jgi:octaprenyl-diphosphate synthase